MVPVTIDTLGYDLSARREIDHAIRDICISQKTDIDYKTSHRHVIIRYMNGNTVEELLETFIQDKDNDIESGGG